MAAPTITRGFRVTRGDATGAQLALLVPTAYRVLHFASAADEATDWNVANPTHPTFYVHSETTPATDYIAISHDATSGIINVASGTLVLQVDGTTVVTVASTGLSFTSGNITVPDDALLGIGTGNTARLSWDTTDANANELLLQMPAGGAVDVPVLAIGQSIESVDLGLYNGVVDPRIALFGVGAVTTAPVIEFRKARGTIASPTVVTTGDDLGTLDFYGAVAAGEYVRAASIRVDMAGTIGTTQGPGTITILTATDAAPSVLTQAILITAAQVVEVTQGTLALGVTGTATGTIQFDGATSGTVTMRPNATAGTWTFELPATAGEAGDVLVTNGSGVGSWNSGVRSVDVQVTDAQMLALLGTDIVLVAAPGANRAIVVHAIYMFFDVTTTAYTIGTAVLAIGYGGDGADIASITEAGWLDTAADAARFYSLGGAVATPVIQTPVANQTVVLRATTADMTGGNAANTLSVRVYYSVIDMVAFT